MAANLDNGSSFGNLVRIAGWGGAACLLLVPLVAMRFTSEVNWTGFDFAFAAGMLLVAGVSLELAVKLSRGNYWYRAGAGAGVGAAFLLVWVTGAVGIIGSERDPANLMYAGVLLVAMVGALVARFRPSGLSSAMAATALAQAAVAIVAVVGGADDVLKVAGVTAMFVGMWLASAWLFRRAASGRAFAA